MSRLGKILQAVKKDTTIVNLSVWDELMRMPGLLILTTDSRFALRKANDFFYEYFECDPSDLEGKILNDFLGDDTHNDMGEAHIKHILSECHVWDYDAHTNLADGSQVVIRWNQCVYLSPDSQLEILSVGIPPRPSETPSSAAPYTEDEPIPSPQQDFPSSSDRSDAYSTNRHAGTSLIEADIRHALMRRGFVLHYQPKIDARTKKIAGAEALVRLAHPERGLLPPSIFMPAAEDSGLIVSIDGYVINAACKRLKKLIDAGHDLFLSVHVSKQQFMSPSFTETILQALARFEVRSDRLMVEITENTAAQDYEKARDQFQILHGLGCRVSMDDFGTGFSSLSFLEKLDIDNIKIDKTFLSNALHNRKAYSIIESIIVLAHGLGMTVTAEGVEAQEQYDFLLDKSCDYIQGYMLGRPLPETEFDWMLNS